MVVDRAPHVALKAAWRRRLLAARDAVPESIRVADTAALAAAAVLLAADVDGPVCAYVAVGSEPGAPAAAGPPVLPAPVPDALLAAGHEVWLPVVPATRGPLDWACYAGPRALADAPFGLREPTGDRLGPGAVARAALVLVPALALDRRGYRIGHGGGYYDRTLPLTDDRTVQRVGVVRDDELVEELPVAPHDVPVSAALTPNRGRLALPR
jgi:5-formyltetrahydrofolate cyclo-ligase